MIFHRACAAALLSVGALSFAPNADAQRSDGALLDRLFQADADGDGALSLEELYGARAQVFNTLDADGNGSISTQEWLEARARDRGQGEAFETLDLDGDGQVSQAEYLERPLTLFEHADANEDEVVTREEAEALRERGRTRFGGGH